MRKHLIKIIGILIFAFILYKVEISSLVSIFSKTRLDYIFAVLVLSIPVVLVKSWRWQYLLKMQCIDYSLKNVFLTYWSGIYIGAVTPGKIGEFARVYYLKEDKGVNTGKAFSSVLGDRLLDLSVLMSFSFMGLVSFSLIGNTVLPLLVFLIPILLMSLVVVNKRLRNSILNFMKSLHILENYKERIEKYCNNFICAIRDFKNAKIVVPIAASLVAYLLFYYQCYLLALSLGINISIINLIYCVSISNVISFIPITISGIGTRDATLIYLFAILGLGEELAVSYSILILAFVYLVAAVFGGIAWWIKPLNIDMISFAPSRNQE